jgi:hypothetical protein
VARLVTAVGAAPSSRTSAAGAGWGCSTPGSYVTLLPAKEKRLSWFQPRMLWRCRNDPLSRLADPVAVERSRWVGDRSDADLTVDLSDRLSSFSFLLMGDTGEGDASQYAVVPPLMSCATGTSFLLICSDVLYPIGDVNDYATKFYQPYTAYPGPVYALPGNHDWYDDLAAFMFHFCDRAEPPAPPSWKEDIAACGAARWRVLVRRLLWRRPAVPDEAAVDTMRKQRAQPAQRQPVRQPGPYYVLDTEHLRLVCIDTGIRGDIDAEQGRWLVRVSADPRPKILLTGKPLLVDGTVHPCAIAGGAAGFRSVLDVVHHAPFRYVASMGGDIHNYQRYPVTVGDRVIQHVVCGGGGAFMHATHLIDRIDPKQVLGVTEEQFRCYPLRRDSLAAYSQVLQGILTRLHIRLPVTLTPAEAATLLIERMGVTTVGGTRAVAPGDQIPRSKRIIAHFLLQLGGRQFHKFFSPFYDWDNPPFFKSFLRIDVSPHGAEASCRAATGCGDAEANSPVEDRFELQWS